jgi:DNA-binding LytR/AlgR family response regulator
MREKIKILVVEDNPVVAEDLRETLTRCDYEVVAVADNGKDALDTLKDSNPDLALLDIHLKGDMTGIDVAQLISDQYDFPFIFLSAYSDNVTFEEAKITGPHAYLVKPFNEKELRLAIELALFNASNRENDIDDTTSKEPAQQFLLKHSIFIKDGKHLAKVQLRDVQYLEAFGSYCKLHSSERVFTFSCILNKILKKIPEEDFVRIHRSYVVNLQHVSSIDGDFIVIKGVKLPISQTYRKILMERLRLV